MNAEPIIQNDFVSMWYYPDKKIVHHQMHKSLYGEHLRSAMETGLSVLIRNGACKWLSDDRCFVTMEPEDVHWGKAVWTPKAVRAGWRHWAIVLPKSVTGKMCHDQMIDDYRVLGLNAKVFDDVDEAMAWLEAQ